MSFESILRWLLGSVTVQKRSDGGLGLALRARERQRESASSMLHTGFIEEKQNRSGGGFVLTLRALRHHAEARAWPWHRLGVGALAGGLGRLLGRGLGLAVFFFGALALLGTLTSGPGNLMLREKRGDSLEGPFQHDRVAERVMGFLPFSTDD